MLANQHDPSSTTGRASLKKPTINENVMAGKTPRAKGTGTSRRAFGDISNRKKVPTNGSDVVVKTPSTTTIGDGGPNKKKVLLTTTPLQQEQKQQQLPKRRVVEFNLGATQVLEAPRAVEMATDEDDGEIEWPAGRTWREQELLDNVGDDDSFVVSTIDWNALIEQRHANKLQWQRDQRRANLEALDRHIDRVMDKDANDNDSLLVCKDVDELDESLDSLLCLDEDESWLTLDGVDLSI